MNTRTDLALEEAERIATTDGTNRIHRQKGPATVTQITIRTAAAAQRLHKPIGRYITVEVPRFSEHADDENRLAPIIAQELRRLIPRKGSALIAGLGNASITRIGPGGRSGSTAARFRCDAGRDGLHGNRNGRIFARNRA